MKRLLIVIPALTALLACSEHTGPEGSDGMIVGVEDNRFTPAQFSVAAGGTVRWEWRGSNPHNVTFADGAASFTGADGQYQRQFTAAGTYAYLCTVHGPAMSGSVVVQ